MGGAAGTSGVYATRIKRRPSLGTSLGFTRLGVAMFVIAARIVERMSKVGIHERVVEAGKASGRGRRGDTNVEAALVSIFEKPKCRPRKQVSITARVSARKICQALFVCKESKRLAKMVRHDQGKVNALMPPRLPVY